MKFPSYVPAAVREFVDCSLEGDDLQEGLYSRLAHAKSQLAVIDIASRCGSSFAAELESRYRQWLLARRTDSVQEIERISGAITCLRSLATDARMRDAFSLLNREFDDDTQWRAFVGAAWAANLDYGPLRDKSKQTSTLARDIAVASRKLAGLLSEFGDARLPRSADPFAIPDLLRCTAPDDRGAAQKWQLFREVVIGGKVRRAIEVDAREMALQDGWRSAPELHLILLRVAAVAEQYQSFPARSIQAAIKTRQRNLKTEYLRAFASLIQEDGGLALTQTMQKAMAIVASVVLTRVDADVTYDDVRKALRRKARPKLENSSAKKRLSVPKKPKGSQRKVA
jgi:hypothetical protein